MALEIFCLFQHLLIKGSNLVPPKKTTFAQDFLINATVATHYIHTLLKLKAKIHEKKKKQQLYFTISKWWQI